VSLTVSHEFALFLPRFERSGVDGEPEWLPSPQQVARARAQLERLGLLRYLAGETAPSVPLEVPWLWWLAAILWIVLWPALITLKTSGQPLAWLPWWLLLPFALLHMALLAVPVLARERDASRDALRRRFAYVQTLPQLLALEPAEFENWCAILFRLMGYRVTSVNHTGDHGVDLQVSGEQGERGLVQCKRYRGTVGEPIVRDLYGTMMHENADRAWLLTTGAISRQAHEWCNGKAIELWDGQSLLAMARRYR
jgi:restriction system protein